jgi:hypothetical protein
MFQNSCSSNLVAKSDKPLPTINFIIAVSSCANTNSFDSELLQGKSPENIVWPGEVTYVLTPVEIETGLSSDNFTVPPLQHILLGRGYKIQQLQSRKVTIVLFQAYQHGLESEFSQIWDWAFSEDMVPENCFREHQRSNIAGPKLNRIAYEDMGNARCPVNAGDRGFLEVSSSLLLLSGPGPSTTANLFCPELIHAGRPTTGLADSGDDLIRCVA